MSYIIPINLRLPARNEGKIKAYESCSDVRAWSHDIQARDRYLREWIRGDMTVCFIPVSTLAKSLRIMTYKSRGKATPRCHPDCKSRVILESICASCDAMKECLKDNGGFQTYFVEEEFETSHWPCERCVEALKSIKLFWKIIVEKLFHISLLKQEDINHEECPRCDSVRSVTKQWQEDIVQQANFVKSFKPLWSMPPFLKNNCLVKDITNAKDKESIGAQYFRKTNNVLTPNTENYTLKSVKATDTNSLSSSVVRKNYKRLTGVRRPSKMVDKYCETCNKENEDKELNAYKTDLLNLQQRYLSQQDEIDKLRTENNSLRIELQNIYKKFSCNCSLYNSTRLRKNIDEVALIPKPFETCTEESIDLTKETDSEMIITMKNCKNESYRHISLLQVLHKSNGPIHNDPITKGTCCEKEDPINILTRVHNTFGDIVKREMSIANERSHRSNKTDIDATYHRMNASRSEPSCTTSAASSSEFFVSSSGDKKAETVHKNKA